MTLKQLQDEIKALGRDEQKLLLAWLESWDDWDQQVYEDAAAGRLSPTMLDVSGPTRPLPETDEEWERALRELAGEGDPESSAAA